MTRTDDETPTSWAIVCPTPPIAAALWRWQGWLVLAVHEAPSSARRSLWTFRRMGWSGLRVLALPKRFTAQPDDMIANTLADRYQVRLKR